MKNNIKSKNENGSAIIISLFVMILLLGFVAFAVSRTNSETVAASNDASETRTFEAAQASLEVMTRNFDKIFETRINVLPSDLNRIQGQIPPNFVNYTFRQTITQTEPNKQVIMTGQEYQGLFSSRDGWTIDTTATEESTGVQVQLRRNFYNNRIPIFQFGIFYDDDLEFHPGPKFDFGGRVHSNASLFLKGNDVNFSSKVTAHGEIYTDLMRNGAANTNDGVKIKNASGNYVNLNHNMGSVLSSPVNGTSVNAGNTDMPAAYPNANWLANELLFQGNLAAQQKTLDLPIRLESEANSATVDYIELIKRGKDINTLWNDKSAGTPTTPNIVPVTAATKDSEVTHRQRYYNGTGIRVSLADSKAKLPGCASGVGTGATANPCGIRLDGASAGNGAEPGAGAARGYVPLPMTDYQATEINGERFFVNGKEMWIKVEKVAYDEVNNLTLTSDITRDFLSMGVTEAAPNVNGQFQIQNPANYYTNGVDTRSIIKLQRFAIVSPQSTGIPDNSYLTTRTLSGIDYTYVNPAESANNTNTNTIDSFPVDNGAFAAFQLYPGTNGQFADHYAHWKQAIVRKTSTPTDTARIRWVVPFPINMFDTREGIYCDNGCNNPDGTAFNPTNTQSANKDGYGTNVPWMGVMSMVDIDVANLRRFLRGDFNTKFPNGLKSSDIPSNSGWILYISDRRGDFDFDGEYDMEDIYGKNDCILQPGEDVNGIGGLDSGGICSGTALTPNLSTEEATTYFKGGLAPLTGNPWKSSFVTPQIAAVLEHKFFRRGVRLINAEKLPGKYDSANAANTQGFTLASENGVYVKGNYNATGIRVGSTGVPTPSEDYEPKNTVDHIPASIAADAITILSDDWSDAKSFTSPFNLNNRVPKETYVRFAMLAGDAKTSLAGFPSQSPDYEPRLGGGVHNFKRFLEKWNGKNLNYTGSLINLYNSHNNNGTYKAGGGANVYGAPNRNWIFDSSFRDPNRLPPGTPFFQFIQLTGFQRVN